MISPFLVLLMGLKSFYDLRTYSRSLDEFEARYTELHTRFYDLQTKQITLMEQSLLQNKIIGKELECIKANKLWPCYDNISVLMDSLHRFENEKH